MEDSFVITKINRVIMIGKEEYPEKTSVFSNELKHNELIFNFSGQATVYFGSQVLKTEPNTVRFLPAGQTDRYKVLREEHGECIDVFFDTDRPIAPSAFLSNMAKNERIGTLFKRLFISWVSKESGYYFDCISLLYRIFSELQKRRYIPKNHEEKLKPAIEMIHNGFLKETFTTEQLAKCCHISESYFKRLFREKYGVPPKKYVIRLKIDHACDLLRLGRYSVGQIAEMSNFSDIYFFSRQFKEYMGVSPTQFIRKYTSSR